MPEFVDVSKMYEKVNDTSQGATITLGEDSPDDEKKIETLVKEAFSGDSFSISNNCKELSDVQHEQRFILFIKFFFFFLRN